MARRAQQTTRTGILAIAQEAGVSPSTVSRVINGTAGVTDEKRKAVEAAIAKYHYEPNRFARSLVTHQSHIIGILIDRSIRYATANTLVQLEEVASNAGYMSVTLTIDKPWKVSLQRALAQLRSLSIDGLVVIAPRVGLADALAASGVQWPLVIINSLLLPYAHGISVVGEQQLEASKHLTEHLIAQGYTRIWHMAGSADWHDEQQRALGWKQALQEHNLERFGKLIQCTWSAQSAYQAIMAEDFSDGMPDAIFVASDHMAYAAIAALRARGIRVPEDIAIAGYDDAEGSIFLDPPLTTIKQDLPAVARTAMYTLLQKIEGKPTDDVVAMEAQLIVRQSSIRAQQKCPPRDSNPEPTSSQAWWLQPNLFYHPFF
ncbi:LacI family transcriptional regulator [Galliscardovia ingluviei]|uniref:LacI family transcriptional regulator n=1 Tax=Galliscardovia ingluviei TaxID=1769422 RepID=A0A8J3EZS6_9BIFI|nr:LacI family DNA-binding transcriptional regulator [Galliscardovia ingluviei]GGI14746.1 LacI family transcriptional regulator [Galliscardovia ingluviei]